MTNQVRRGTAIAGAIGLLGASYLGYTVAYPYVIFFSGFLHLEKHILDSGNLYVCKSN